MKEMELAVESKKLLWLHFRLLLDALLYDFMILFYIETNLWVKTEKGFASAHSYPLINDAPDSMQFWEVPYEAYHTIITVYSSCLVSMAGLGNHTRIRF